MKRLSLACGGVSAEAALFEHEAPRTVQALWERLPIVDRTINVRWSGDAWRTEGNYELLPADAAVENVAGRLSAGDIIYYPDYAYDLVKIGVAYGDAQWLGPFCEILEVALIGHIDRNLDAFVERCERIIFDGPLPIRISRIENSGVVTEAAHT